MSQQSTRTTTSTHTSMGIPPTEPPQVLTPAPSRLFTTLSRPVKHTASVASHKALMSPHRPRKHRCSRPLASAFKDEYDKCRTRLEEAVLDPWALTFEDEELEEQYQQAYEAKSLRHIRLGAIGILFVTLLLGALDTYLYDTNAGTVRLVRFAIVAPLEAAYCIFTFSEIFLQNVPAFTSLYGVLFGVGMCALAIYGNNPEHGTMIIYFVFAFNFLRLRFIYAIATATLVWFLYVLGSVAFNGQDAEDLFYTNFQALMVFLVSASACYITERFYRRDFLVGRIMDVERQAMRVEKQTADSLLENVLPCAIIGRLKQNRQRIAEGFESVTVLFADIVGFTTLSADITPEQLVMMLNKIFSVFDLMAGKYGLEKVKTIGDCYMVVGGLPIPRDDHVEAVANMALDMLEGLTFIKMENGRKLQIRIGIHTGPVVAGVIGIKKFSYDLWGDTVNTASRMESHGAPGRIHISKVTADLLETKFKLESRGTQDIKGKGPMQTYFLQGRLSESERQCQGSLEPEAMVERALSSEELNPLDAIIANATHTTLHPPPAILACVDPISLPLPPLGLSLPPNEAPLLSFRRDPTATKEDLAVSLPNEVPDATDDSAHLLTNLSDLPPRAPGRTLPPLKERTKKAPSLTEYPPPAG